MDDLRLKKYTDDYYEFVYETKKNAYKKYVCECWGDWIEVDQRNHFVRFINVCRENTYIVEYDGKDIGFYNYLILEDGTYEIGNICINKEYQGMGLGTRLLNRILEENKDKDIKLQFFKQNRVGSLYKRLGFVMCGETEYHYQMVKPKQSNLVK